jgi:protease-4
MTKFLLGLISGIFLCVILAVIVVMVAVSVSGRAPSISGDSTLVLELSGDIPERNPTDVPAFLLQQGARPTLKEIHDLLRKAAVDRRVKAVVVKPNGLAAGWGKTQEIRSGLEEFKKSKKPLLAYLQVAGMREYYLATAADKVYLAPEGLLDVKGMRAEVMFFKNTLNKLGVQAEMEHIGKYKSFSEPFTRTDMSEAYREVTNSILDAALDDFLRTVAPARQMRPDELRRVLDEGPFLPAQAQEARLADGLLYEDQVFAEIRKLTKTDSDHRLKPADYSRISLESLGLAGGSRIAVVYAVGAIYRGESVSDPLDGSQSIGSDSFCKVLREVAEDESIKGVIARIDSPGGDSFASDQIWREMNRLSEKKPMVISMSDVAASGGYYMAMSGDPVLAYPSTYTGSIGVVYGKLNLRGLYDKIGVNKEILSRGKNAEIDTDYRGFTPAERQKVLEEMTTIYRSFVQKVADSRGRKWEEIDKLAQGRVWFGSQAKQNGLVDELGGFDRAIERIKQEAKLRPDDKVTLVAYPPQKTLFELIMEHSRGFGEIRTWWPEVRDQLGALIPWSALLEGGMMKISPYWIAVH